MTFFILSQPYLPEMNDNQAWEEVCERFILLRKWSYHFFRPWKYEKSYI